jgi:hypothetical protein
VPWHVARLVTWLVASLVVDYSASRRLVVNYFAYTARPGASARRAARRATAVDYSVSRRLVVDYFSSAARPGASARRAARRAARRSSSTTPPRIGSSSTTLPLPLVRVPRHVAWIVSWLVALLVVDYSASHRLVVD